MTQHHHNHINNTDIDLPTLVLVQIC